MMSKIVLAGLVVVGVSAERGGSVLPPGIANFASSKLYGLQDYELDLHPPEEDKRIVNDQINALKAIEIQADKAAESEIIASKQRLLNAEIASIRSIVASNARKPGSAFLGSDTGRTSMTDAPSLFGSLMGHSEFQLNLHPHEELAGDIKSHADALLKVEDAKLASATAAFVADKKRVLQAGLGELRRIVADAVAPVTGKFSGLAVSEKLAPPAVIPVLNAQTSWQAGLPSEVHINYDVPTFGLESELNAIKAASEP